MGIVLPPAVAGRVVGVGAAGKNLAVMNGTGHILRLGLPV